MYRTALARVQTMIRGVQAHARYGLWLYEACVVLTLPHGTLQLTLEALRRWIDTQQGVLHYQAEPTEGFEWMEEEEEGEEEEKERASGEEEEGVSGEEV
eukprot:3941502-Rhodomonas_salina.4